MYRMTEYIVSRAAYDERNEETEKRTLTHFGQTSEHIPRRNWIYASNKCCDLSVTCVCVCLRAFGERRQ